MLMLPLADEYQIERLVFDCEQICVVEVTKHCTFGCGIGIV